MVGNKVILNYAAHCVHMTLAIWYMYTPPLGGIIASLGYICNSVLSRNPWVNLYIFISVISDVSTLSTTVLIVSLISSVLSQVIADTLTRGPAVCIAHTV